MGDIIKFPVNDSAESVEEKKVFEKPTFEEFMVDIADKVNENLYPTYLVDYESCPDFDARVTKITQVEAYRGDMHEGDSGFLSGELKEGTDEFLYQLDAVMETWATDNQVVLSFKEEISAWVERKLKEKDLYLGFC